MQTDALPINRRRHERFETLPMYTAIEAVTPDGRVLEGHAYDVSEGGVRFELDEAISPGTPVTLRLTLPRWLPAPIDDADAIIEPKPVEVLGDVRWTDDDEVRGPVRMAASFTAFLDAAARERLLHTLAAGALRRAA